MYALLDLCQKLYKPRPCHQPMTEVGVKTGKYELCLNYHIHKCEGACVGKQTHEEYMRNIEACREILKGNTRAVAQHLRDEMARLSEEMRFEEAAILKRKYDLIENFRAKSEVVSQISYDIDVFSIESDEKLAYINFLHVVNGAITQSFTFEFKKKLDESDEDLLALGIVEMRERFESKSKEIVLPFLVELPDDYAKLVIPQQGGKKTLLDLSRQNVKQYKFDRLKQAEKLNPEQKQVRLMKEIQTQLGLPSLPLRIEIFDNSNISGADAVAGCVVFDKLKPAKKEYRKFHIKTVEGPDDYASMREVVHRRYARLKEEEGTMPNLIIADGGRGQMEAIRGEIEALGLNIPVAGLVKDHRHRTRELLFGNPPVSVGVQLDSYLFKVLTQMQDEVHRFAITFHRQQRSKRQTASALDNIPGIGEKTKQTLIQHFGSVKQILATTVEQFQEVLGEKRGAKLFEALHPTPTSEKEV
jgi:excinuclease ABC, C subunit